MAEHTTEGKRLAQDSARTQNWKRWGPYLAERQWGTVREDYSAGGECWSYFSHSDAASRAYRWGEDGLMGITDRECRLCFGLALWNGKDPILKERLFGLTGPEGNHGEDVKECYFYLDSTPTHSYLRSLYKYPQAEFPYQRLKEENQRRGRDLPEFELVDTGVFDQQRYFDVTVEYAKGNPDDILILVTVVNHGPEAAALHLLPTLWFRNSWSWGCTHEGCGIRPRMRADGDDQVVADHETLGRMRWALGPGPDGKAPQLLFTENDTNQEKLFHTASPTAYVKDAFHRRVVGGEVKAVNPNRVGSKVALVLIGREHGVRVAEGHPGLRIAEHARTHRPLRIVLGRQQRDSDQQDQKDAQRIHRSPAVRWVRGSRREEYPSVSTMNIQHHGESRTGEGISCCLHQCNGSLPAWPGCSRTSFGTR